jgi:hypothetical protein
MKATINAGQEDMKAITNAIQSAQTKFEETTSKRVKAIHKVLSSEKEGKENLCEEDDKELQDMN